MNEFHTRPYDGYTEGIPFWHCPACGGTALESKRGSFFAPLTDMEQVRLLKLTRGLRTVAEVIARLGPPDADLPDGFGEGTPASGTKAPTFKSYRVLRYENLSETARVDLVDRGPDHGIGLSLQGKYLGKPKARPPRRGR